MASDIVAGLGVPGVKAALDAVGLVGGPVRQPLLALGASQRQAVEQLMAPAMA
jgi:dihydrodipicolinate synthase/N-acetylneuraminate lyase